ncbi:MAG: restriction endonuclease subunit S, partial [bacterium]
MGDIADVVSERVSISKATLDNYISTENMINDFGGVTKAEKLPIATSVNSFNQNDTLFSNIRTYFKKVWLSKFNGTVSPDVLVFRARENKCISA